jgi:hypothetical protein
LQEEIVAFALKCELVGRDSNRAVSHNVLLSEGKGTAAACKYQKELKSLPAGIG